MTIFIALSDFGKRILLGACFFYTPLLASNNLEFSSKEQKEKQLLQVKWTGVLITSATLLGAFYYYYYL